MISFDVHLNDRQVGQVTIHRLEGASHPSNVNTYEATFEWVELDGAAQRRHVTFTHTYGDPWPAMLHAALDALRLSGVVR
ncbi:hypothetical protein [Mycobacterium sp. SMC-4]|uniref:hypothetical protein n=1 Tax=Mycobacterium sp. SMC-4 TaxID=2857059 RepID=UPI0021B4698D|nr:hypothetical protein [Mycobacterium sp. SMC-4]UXA19510.1 hypothetical protein KXD98_07895 [Mycobacterium sp. SMC-4]